MREKGRRRIIKRSDHKSKSQKVELNSVMGDIRDSLETLNKQINEQIIISDEIRNQGIYSAKSNKVHTIVGYVLAGVGIIISAAGIMVSVHFVYHPVIRMEEAIVKVADEVDKQASILAKLDSEDSKAYEGADKLESAEIESKEIKETEIVIRPDRILSAVVDGVDVYNGRVEFGNLEGENSDILIATDIKTGVKYSISDLVDKPFIFSYRDGEEDVFFCGQYNEDEKWDGICTENRYVNQKLRLSVQLNYRNGSIVSREYMYANVGDWYYFISSGSEMIGYTWKYAYNDIIQSISSDNMSSNDLLSPGDCRNVVNGTLKHLYYGNISDGLYNDDSGEAWMIVYNDDNEDDEKKTLKTLYSGNIKDGVFNDDTGDAWYISRSDGNYYVYYLGIFKDGEAIEFDDDNNIPLSYSAANRIISSKEFEKYINLDMSCFEEIQE